MVWDAIAQADLMHAPLCILSLDFTAAFDRFAHTSLFRMLKSHGFSMRFNTLIHAIYDQAFSSVQINGYVTGPFPIRCSVRQGCPMSMLLFALVLNPMLCLLEQNLTGIRSRHCTTQTAVVAYADDVTIFVTAPEDIQVIRDLLRKGKWCLLEHPKIQSLGGRLVGYTDKSNGHPTLSGNNHNGFQIHEYDSPVRECHLVERDRKCQSAGERRVTYGPVSNTTST